MSSLTFSSSSDEEDFFLYMWWRRLRRLRTKKHRLSKNPYITRNVRNRSLVGAIKEKQESDIVQKTLLVAADELKSNVVENSLLSFATSEQHQSDILRNPLADSTNRELQESDSKFVELYTMSKDSYLALVKTINPAIRYVDTNMRECVSAEDRILITLRYLATGCTFTSLGLHFSRGESTIGKIVSETTKIIWDILKDIYLPCPSSNQWETNAERFLTLWKLPNCIGALGYKIIRLGNLPTTSYKSSNSIVLLGCCDADGIFTMIETGKAGSDYNGAFEGSEIKKMFSESQLDIPPRSKLPLDDCLFPYYFIGDDNFPLSLNLLRPYSNRNNDNTKRNFNSRLSFGRESIESTFKRLTDKFNVLNTGIRCKDDRTISNIVKCACVLHNYVIKRDGRPNSPQVIAEQGIPDFASVICSPTRNKVRLCSSANEIRDYLANYLTLLP